MDNLMEALKTGSAFSVGRDKRGERKRTPRVAGGENSLLYISLVLASVRTRADMHT